MRSQCLKYLGHTFDPHTLQFFPYICQIPPIGQVWLWEGHTSASDRLFNHSVLRFKSFTIMSWKKMTTKLVKHFGPQLAFGSFSCVNKIPQNFCMCCSFIIITIYPGARVSNSWPLAHFRPTNHPHVAHNSVLCPGEKSNIWPWHSSDRFMARYMWKVPELQPLLPLCVYLFNTLVAIF